MCLYAFINVELPGHGHEYFTSGNTLEGRQTEQLGLRGTDMQ